MKLNLECGNDFRNSHLNITSNVGTIPQNLPANTVVIPGHPLQLEPLNLKGPIEEIVFNPFLNNLAPQVLPQALKYWQDKLAPNGVLKVAFIDIKRVGRGINTETLNLQEIHSLTIGLNKEFNSVIDTATLRIIAKELNFHVDSIVHQDYYGKMEFIKQNDSN